MRTEDLMIREAGVSYPICISGHGLCPPEDCVNPAAFMSGEVHGDWWKTVDELQTSQEVLAVCRHLKIAGRVACLMVSSGYQLPPPKLQHIH
jgi:hypothetical protein